MGHSNSARKQLEKLVVGVLSPEEAALSKAAKATTSAQHGGSLLPYILAVLALAAGLAYQFLLVPKKE